MTGVLLPIHEAVRDLVAALLDRQTVVEAIRAPVAEAELGALAVYRADDGPLLVVGLFDRSSVLMLGGALTLVPKPVLDDARRAGDLPPVVVENFWEVANVFGAALNRVAGRHMRLTDRLVDLPGAPDDVLTAMGAPARTRSFMINVDGYGSGEVTLLAADVPS